MMTWVPGKARDDVPNMTHGEGVYLVDDTGKRYMDWTSQAVCANLGHDVPEAVVKAAAQQMETLQQMNIHDKHTYTKISTHAETYFSRC